MDDENSGALADASAAPRASAVCGSSGDVNGSVTLLDGHVGFSRQVGRAFGLVALPGYPDVRVYVDNREAGRTDQSGYLLLPGLRPYEANKVRLAVDDLPIDAQLKGAFGASFTPLERSTDVFSWDPV